MWSNPGLHLQEIFELVMSHLGLRMLHSVVASNTWFAYRLRSTRCATNCAAPAPLRSAKLTAGFLCLKSCSFCLKWCPPCLNSCPSCLNSCSSWLNSCPPCLNLCPWAVPACARNSRFPFSLGFFSGTRLDKIYRHFFVLKRAPAYTQKKTKEPKTKEKATCLWNGFFCLSLMFKRRQQRSSKQPTHLELRFVLLIEVHKEAKAADQTRTSKKKKKKKEKRKRKEKEKKRNRKKKKRKKKRKKRRKKRQKKNEKYKKRRKIKREKRRKGPKRQPHLSRSRAPAFTQKAKNKRKLRNALCAPKLKNTSFSTVLRHKLRYATRA